jgi:hypothetical protein
MDHIPHLSYDLIDKLDKEFPERCARAGMSIEDIWREAGRREVINALLRIRDEEAENILSMNNV